MGFFFFFSPTVLEGLQRERGTYLQPVVVVLLISISQYGVLGAVNTLDRCIDSRFLVYIFEEHKLC